MTAPDDPSNNPFQDPSLNPSSVQSAESSHDTDSTLVVGRDASLTLGTDSLIVLDEAIPPPRSPLQSCCGLINTRSAGPPTRSIPYHNILWASLNDYDLTIHHAHPVSKQVVRTACVAYPVIKSDRTQTQAWVDRLLGHAYGASQRQKRLKVLVNPFGGQGYGRKCWIRDIEPILSAAQCSLDVEYTTHRAHAVDIAEQLDTDAFDAIVCCSGDGVPHEVFNGLGKKKDAVKALASVAVVQLPCGSGNAMSLNLNGTDSPSMAALEVVKGLRTSLDLMSVTQGDKRFLSFLSQSTGLVAATDLGTEHLRWMGDARFTYGFFTRLIMKAQYPCDVSFKLITDDKSAIRARNHRHRDGHPSVSEPSRVAAEEESSESLPALSHGAINDPLPASWTPLTSHNSLGTFFAGKMAYMARDANFFPAALPDDGAIDIIMIDANISRWSAVRSLLAIADGSLFELPYVYYAKVEGFRIIPRPGGRGAMFGRLGKMLGNTRRRGAQKPDGFISIDGERVPFDGFQVEINRGLGTTLSRTGRAFEVPPLK